MAKETDNILEKARRAGLATPSAGMDVPAGYFASFAERMEQSLPPRPELEAPQQAEAPRTLWQKVRPYVYMAAMFAGVWLMMQMFASLGGLAPVDKNPVLAEALSTDEFVFDYVYQDMSAWELVDDMIDEGVIDEDFDFAGLDDMSAADDSTYILP